MTKKSPLNVVLILMSLGIALLVFLLGELLLAFLAGLPDFLQCAIYLTFVTGLIFAGVYLSEKIRSGNYILQWRNEFNGTCAKAAGILIPCALAAGLLTQLLFGFIFAETREEVTFRQAPDEPPPIEEIGDPGGPKVTPDREVSSTVIDLIVDMDVSGEALDLVFVVDTTGSMGEYIDEVKVDIANIISTTLDQTEDFRIALIDYRDFPERSYEGVPPGDLEFWDEMDYPAMLQLDFTNDEGGITEAINALTLGFGGDEPETLYSGLMMAMDDLGWRAGAQRHIIVLSDATPLDPEPYTDYTMKSVTDALVAAEIQIHLIGVGGYPEMITYFEQIADLADGSFVSLKPNPIWGGEAFDPGFADDPEVIDDPEIAEEPEIAAVPEVPAPQKNNTIREVTTWTENPHLLLPFASTADSGALRIAIHAILLALWGIFTGIAVIMFLNNNKLFSSFFIPRIIVSVVVAVAFALLIDNASASDLDLSRIARALLAMGICLLYLPTYSWNQNEQYSSVTGGRFH